MNSISDWIGANYTLRRPRGNGCWVVRCRRVSAMTIRVKGKRKEVCHHHWRKACAAIEATTRL